MTLIKNKYEKTLKIFIGFSNIFISDIVNEIKNVESNAVKKANIKYDN